MRGSRIGENNQNGIYLKNKKSHTMTGVVLPCPRCLPFADDLLAIAENQIVYVRARYAVLKHAVQHLLFYLYYNFSAFWRKMQGVN